MLTTAQPSHPEASSSKYLPLSLVNLKELQLPQESHLGDTLQVSLIMDQTFIGRSCMAIGVLHECETLSGVERSKDINPTASVLPY